MNMTVGKKNAKKIKASLCIKFAFGRNGAYTPITAIGYGDARRACGLRVAELRASAIAYLGY
jgi:hypothetical protein